MIRLFYLSLLITFLLDSLFSGALDCIYGDDCLDFRFHSSRNQNQLAVEEYNVFLDRILPWWTGFGIYFELFE